jgi:hypothetical protein
LASASDIAPKLWLDSVKLPDIMRSKQTVTAGRQTKAYALRRATVEAALMENSSNSNNLISYRLGIGVQVVTDARVRLERSGVIAPCFYRHSLRGSIVDVRRVSN